jgi:hypothetical protein
MASTGMTEISRSLALLLILPYIKIKTYKTSSNSRWQGKVENLSNPPAAISFGLSTRVNNQAVIWRSAQYDWTCSQDSICALHSFHIYSTATVKEEPAVEWKSLAQPRFIRPIARSVY